MNEGGNALCRHCDRLLDEGEQVAGKGHCNNLACRILEARAINEFCEKSKKNLETKIRELAANELQNPPVTLIWLKPNDVDIIDTSNDEYEEHRSYLRKVVKDGNVRLPRFPDRNSKTTAQGNNLCAQCLGLCCRPGAQGHAFIDIDVLGGWQRNHSGSCINDAVEAYMDMLPVQHVKGSCLYHSTNGCAIMRQDRSATCNEYACDALNTLQKLVAKEKQISALVITPSSDNVVAQRAAVIGPDGIHSLYTDSNNLKKE